MKNGRRMKIGRATKKKKRGGEGMFAFKKWYENIWLGEYVQEVYKGEGERG
jgi:hypothetical protein